MSVVLVLTLLTALPTVLLALRHGLNQVVAIDTLALVWALAIWRLDYLPYKVRVWNFIGMMFGVAISMMITIDAVGLSYMLIAASVMAVVLLGVRSALLTLACSATLMVVLGVAGYSHLTIAGFPSDSLSGVLIFTLNFTGIGVLITLTCGTLLEGLSGSLSKVRDAAHSLEEGQAALQTLNGKLGLTSAALAGLNEMVLIAEVVEGANAPPPVIFANPAFERRSGYAAKEIIGHSLYMLHGPDTDLTAVAKLVDAARRREAASAQLVHYTKAGEPYWVEIEMVPFRSEGRSITHWVVAARDITEQRRAADAIHRLAFYDVLTGLPNRRLLLERLDAMVAKAKAGCGLGSVLYIDLDNFKDVNDAKGHATGDALLNLLAARLREEVRDGDTVARLGGDEFVVLLEGLGTDEVVATSAALDLAKQLGAALAHPAYIDGQAYHSSASIGVAMTMGTGQTANDLLREADTAMYHAKSSGANGVSLYAAAMLDAAEDKLTLERGLAGALLNDELMLHLQLQVDTGGAAVGAEALLRWRDASGALIPPDVFIPVAETSGLIVPIGAWVLRQACLAWIEMHRAGVALPLSVNVSPRQFRQAGFVEDVRATLLATRVPPDQIVLEVTEGLLIDDMDETVTRMSQLAQLGIRFSIDDFGTGYSNLAYLGKMPLYELKIDKSFMRGIPHDVQGAAIVRSILAMAEHLGLRVVAEGIETTEQADFLALHGAPHMQGYLFCRPMPVPDLIERLGAVPEKQQFAPGCYGATPFGARSAASLLFDTRDETDKVLQSRVREQKESNTV